MVILSLQLVKVLLAAAVVGFVSLVFAAMSDRPGCDGVEDEDDMDNRVPLGRGLLLRLQ